MIKESDLIIKLMDIGDFKMSTSSKHCGLVIEAGGISYDGSCFSVEEALFNGAVHILAHHKALDLVKRAKVVL